MSAVTLAIRAVLTDRALRAAAIVIFLQGAVVCSFGPYFSALAVETFGFGDRGFALLLALSTAVSVAASVGAGIRADQTARRRPIALGAVMMLLAGTGLLTLAPGPWTFALAYVVLLPLASTLFGQVFALARLAAQAHPADRRDGILAVVRALFAAPFVLVLPLWAVAFGLGAPVLAIFPAGLALSGAMFWVVRREWPRDGAAGWEDPPSGLSLRAALAELARLPIVARILCLGAVNAAPTTYMALIALVMVADVGRGPGDVALYVGLVAGLEVPFMLALPALARGWSRPVPILLGAGLYAVHLAFLPMLAGSALVWLLVLPAAMGGAVTLTVPIAYLQDLMAARPGTGASLLALQRLAGDIMAAAAFATGTMIAGYGLVAALGVAISVAGAGLLVALDRIAPPRG